MASWYYLVVAINIRTQYISVNKHTVPLLLALFLIVGAEAEAKTSLKTYYDITWIQYMRIIPFFYVSLVTSIISMSDLHVGIPLLRTFRVTRTKATPARQKSRATQFWNKYLQNSLTLSECKIVWRVPFRFWKVGIASSIWYCCY